MQDQSEINAHFIDADELRAFFSECLTKARAEACPKIASISMPFNYLAPLAVLQSLARANQLHFYSERPVEDSAVLAMGAVRHARFSGAERFENVRAFTERCLQEIMPYSSSQRNNFDRPHFFTAFTFEDELMTEGEFAPATVFLPEWHLFSDSGYYGLVLNIEVSEGTSVDQLYAHFEKTYQHFLSFDYVEDKPTVNEPVTPVDLVEEEGTHRLSFERSVAAALEEIEAKHYQKIVLAQKRVFKNISGLKGIDCLDRLREQFSTCHTFSFSDGSDKQFIGASPEILVEVNSGKLLTQAIAGSSSRGRKALEDARLGSSLLSSDKNLREHNLVKESIVRRLSQLGIQARADTKPRLLALSNVQHLKTMIRGAMNPGVHFLEVVSELFPTPAVGGQPREQAVPRIRSLEGFDRGLYAGLLGWFNDQSEGRMIVGIRSAQFDRSKIEICAGAGIVSGSQLEIEKGEIELKQNAMLSLLR